MTSRALMRALAFALLVTAAPALAQKRPPDQIMLTQAFDVFAARVPGYAGETELEKQAAHADYSAIVTERAHRLCELTPDLTVHGWRGFLDSVAVSRLHQTAVITVLVSGAARLTNEGQRVASSEFPALTQLEHGSLVEFDGAFVRSRTDCLQEQGWSDRTSLVAPRFSFRFTRIEPVSRSATDVPASLDVASIERLSGLRYLASSCGQQFHYYYEMGTAFAQVEKSLPKPDQDIAHSAWFRGFEHAAQSFVAHEPGVCDPVTPEIVAHLEELTFGDGSLLHDRPAPAP